MFMGIDRDAWISIWAGALGAIPAAVLSAAVAAWVAVTVLNRSNEHQQKLAADGIEKQKQLAEQQLSEQRAEAGRVRERAALSDVLFAAEALTSAAEESGPGVRRSFSVLTAAMARWRIELGSGSMQLELMKYSALLMALTADVIEAKESGVREPIVAARQSMVEAVGDLSLVALRWPSSNPEERAFLQKRLSERRAQSAGSMERAVSAHR